MLAPSRGVLSRTSVLLLVSAGLACSGSGFHSRGSESSSAAPTRTASAGDAPADIVDPVATGSADCDDAVPVYEDGEPTDEEVCPDTTDLAIVSLDDDWTPRVLQEAPELGERGAQPYRDTYLALANERFDVLDDENSERRYLELYGIFPTRSLLIARLQDQERHQCHAAIDDTPLTEFEGRINFRWDPDLRGRLVRRHRNLKARVERLVEREEEVDEPSDLEDHPEHSRVYERFERSREAVEAIRTAQEHLACDGMIDLEEVERGVLDVKTMRALRRYQRKHFVVGRGHLAEDTVDALAEDSRELDFRATLRMLRERVVDATGLLADGSASHGHREVLGRELDPPELRFRSGQPAAPNGAPDRIAEATEAAAEALGLTDPETAAEQLRALPERVAIRLPESPTFLARDGNRVMWTEIHKGEADGERGPDHVARPVMTIYAMEGDQPVALVRWPTTIGGVKEVENSAGWVHERRFESPTGEFVWRDVVASPAWLPPPSTPDEALTLGGGSSWRPNDDLLGPGYESAYGLAMVIHHRIRESDDPDEEPRFIDDGIRSHGSVSYRSITHGTSHGCHRLYNHLAVRLTSHLLAHRRHTREGNEELNYSRVVRHRGRSAKIEVDSRGYFYELDPPVEVLVAEGEAPGPNDAPIRFTQQPEQ